jgi:hypothetical protein
MISTWKDANASQRTAQEQTGESWKRLSTRILPRSSSEDSPWYPGAFPTRPTDTMAGEDYSEDLTGGVISPLPPLTHSPWARLARSSTLSRTASSLSGNAPEPKASLTDIVSSVACRTSTDKLATQSHRPWLQLWAGS